jgi:hypothetical protein
MSHQATFTDAANLARAALTGTRGVATPTLTAPFHAMEARALARLGDAKSCARALAEGTAEFERANSENDPLWIRYFNQLELSAEFGHCMRDHGCAAIRVGEAEQACAVVLGALSDGDQIRSARCVSYLHEFGKHLPASAGGAIAEFREQASGSRLWRIASHRNAAEPDLAQFSAHLGPGR